MFCQKQLPEEEGGAKVADFTAVETVHAELEAVRLEARHARQEAAKREAVLHSTLSSALADERKAAAQSVDLAAKLADVQKQLQEATDAKDEMAMIVEEAWKTATEQRELQELASASAGKCKVILEDVNFKVYELERALEMELSGERARWGWRLEREKVGGGTGRPIMSKGRGRSGRMRLLPCTLLGKECCSICNMRVSATISWGRCCTVVEEQL